eukprot:TRINITY_DN64322_c0_g1_i1.p1 TRINITY_DN64322_c0_g1~~TRINITY_DN64322_c0_g1_i1.p1  ORF type:complete len:274 (+),score=42.46 TRINITY_DN64322_c0_g1_i1:33-854(+)
MFGGGGRALSRAYVAFGATADMPGIMPMDGSPVGAKGLQDQKMDDSVFADPMKKVVNGRSKDKLEWVGEGLLPQACDKLGRIPKPFSLDGATCRFDDACVSALPHDLYRQTLTPLCIQGGMDICKAAAGRPFCIPMNVLESYGGPIEVNCNHSGRGVFLGPQDPVPQKHVDASSISGDPSVPTDGSLMVKRPNPTGCWWAKRARALDKNHGLLRHPGQILRPGVPERGWFVQRGHNGVTPLTEDEADAWMKLGELPKQASLPAAKAAAFLLLS